MESILGLLPLLLVVAVMIWMIVSQRRRQREVAQMQASLAVGEDVLTVGGVIGRLVEVDGPILGLEVSPGVVIRVDRRTISGRTGDVPAFGAPGRHAAPGSATAPTSPTTSSAASSSGDSTVASTPGSSAARPAVSRSESADETAFHDPRTGTTPPASPARPERPTDGQD